MIGEYRHKNQYGALDSYTRQNNKENLIVFKIGLKIEIVIGEYRHKNLTLQNDFNFRRKILCKFKVHKKVVEIFLTDIGIADAMPIKYVNTL